MCYVFELVREYVELIPVELTKSFFVFAVHPGCLCLLFSQGLLETASFPLVNVVQL